MFKSLPARWQGYSWKLLFSTSEHGFSLQSLYRKLATYSESSLPVIIFIKDTGDKVIITFFLTIII